MSHDQSVKQLSSPSSSVPNSASLSKISTPSSSYTLFTPLPGQQVFEQHQNDYIDYQLLEDYLHQEINTKNSNQQFSSLQALSDFLSEHDQTAPSSSSAFLLNLQQQLKKLNQQVYFKLENLWTRSVDIASELPANFDNQCCQLLLQNSCLKCDAIQTELADLNLFCDQNVKMCADLLQAFQQRQQQQQQQYQIDDYIQIVEKLALKKIKFDIILISLSQIYQHIRQLREGGEVHDNEGDEPMALDQIQRVTYKYWIQKEHALKIQAAVSEHLPIMHQQGPQFQFQIQFGHNSVNNPEKIHEIEGNSASAKISSVYFDSQNFENYNKRLTNEEEVAVKRIRWYGKRDPNSQIQKLFVERKSYKNDWTGPVTIKERVKILQRSVVFFLSGKKIPEMENRDSSADILFEIQDQIFENQETPVFQSIYDRISFQRPMDSGVRITFDSNIQSIKENGKFSWLKQNAQNAQNAQNVSNFKYCVMEVKLQKDAPSWLKNIIELDEVIYAQGFSKFLHGISVLHHEENDFELPYWVQKQSEKNVNIMDIQQMSRRSKINSLNIFPENTEEKSPSFFDTNQENILNNKIPALHEDSDDFKLPNYPTIVINQKVDIKQEQNIQIIVQQPLPEPPIQKENFANPINADNVDDNVKNSTKIINRTRVEPKVFFANERTFLSWLTVAILIMFSALSLINQHLNTFQNQGGEQVVVKRCQASGMTKIQCEAGLISGAILAPTAMIVIGYSLYTYRKRTLQILRRDVARYDDQLGPLFLTLILVSVMVLSFSLSVIAAF